SLCLLPATHPSPPVISTLSLHDALPISFRPAGQPSAVQFCSNKIVHAPGHSFGIIQTMLLALPNFGLERMGREKPLQIENLMRPAAGRIFGFLRAKHAQESISGVAAAVLSAPIARRNEASLTGPPGWTGRGSWRTTRLTIRGRRQ